MSTQTYYPNGQVLTSSALTVANLNSALQGLIAQSLGLILPTAPLMVTGTTEVGSTTITEVSAGGAYPGCVITGDGVPLGAGIVNVVGSTITLLAPATAASAGVALTIYDSNPWAKVRIAWSQRGQPGFLFASDIATIRLSEVDVEYNKIRNLTTTSNDGVSVTQTYTYQRTWRCFLSFYGPNGFDNSRMLKSALLLDWTHDLLATLNVYVVPGFSRTIRAPELVDGQWAERSDWDFFLNEGVTETIVTPTVASVEVQTFVGTDGVSIEVSDQTFDV
jgi:hypothetical protein